MGIATILTIAALASALVLSSARLSAATVAAGAAALQLCFALRWVSFSIGNLPITTILAVTLCVCGFMLYSQERTKNRLTAAIVVFVVGIIQTLSAFGITG